MSRPVTGREVVIEVALPTDISKFPTEEEYLALGALTDKSKDYSPNTVTSSADNTLGFVASIVTQSDMSISVSGEVHTEGVGSELNEFGVDNLEMFYVERTQLMKQPALFVRMAVPNNKGGFVVTEGLMVITALSTAGGTNDIYTFDTEFKPSDSNLVRVIETDDTLKPINTGKTVAQYIAEKVAAKKLQA